VGTCRHTSRSLARLHRCSTSAASVHTAPSWSLTRVAVVIGISLTVGSMLFILVHRRLALGTSFTFSRRAKSKRLPSFLTAGRTSFRASSLITIRGSLMRCLRWVWQHPQLCQEGPLQHLFHRQLHLPPSVHSRLRSRRHHSHRHLAPRLLRRPSCRHLVCLFLLLLRPTLLLLLSPRVSRQEGLSHQEGLRQQTLRYRRQRT
jgi:hypothetical protein